MLARFLLSQEFAPQRVFRWSVPPGSLVLVLLAWGLVAAFMDERAMAGQARVQSVRRRQSHCFIDQWLEMRNADYALTYTPKSIQLIKYLKSDRFYCSS
ncbi:MAG: hypothetical protein WBM59_06350 [Sedimenticolaceae bacterium]